MTTAPAARTVLIMEDDIDLASQWADAFRANGYDVTLCVTSGEALQHLDEQPVDVAVIDMFIRQPAGGLSGQGGLNVISRLRMRTAERIDPARTRIIAVSGVARNEYLDVLAEARGIGADEALQKPVSVVELVATANRLLDQLR